jgi:hypothetical protein
MFFLAKAHSHPFAVIISPFHVVGMQWAVKNTNKKFAPPPPGHFSGVHTPLRCPGTVHFNCTCMLKFCVENFQNPEKSISDAISISHVL